MITLIWRWEIFFCQLSSCLEIVEQGVLVGSAFDINYIIIQNVEFFWEKIKNLM
jgi:hypothetical protein